MPLHKTDEEMQPQPLRTERTPEKPPVDGQNSSYVVIADADRNPDDFVRPVRYSYLHIGEYLNFPDPQTGDRVFEECGAITTMSQRIAETYARDPSFYGSTYCVQCRAHYSVGEHGMFVWVAEGGSREYRDGKPWKVGT